MIKEKLIEKLGNIPYFMIPKKNKEQEIINFFWNKSGKFELYTLTPKTKHYSLVSGSIPYSSIVLLPEENALIYNKDTSGNEHYALYKVHLKTHKEEQLTTPSFHSMPYQLSPDKKFLLFSASEPKISNIFKMNLLSKEITQLTDLQNSFYGYACWSPDGWIYFNANDTSNPRNMDIWAVKEDGSEVKKIYSASTGSREFVFDLSKDGSLLVFKTDSQGTRAGIINLRTNEVKLLGSTKYDETPMEISNNNQSLVAIRYVEIDRIPIIYDVQSGEETIINVKGFVREAFFCLNDKQLIYSRSNSTTPPFLAMYNLHKEKEIAITNPFLGLRRKDFVDAQYVKYPSFDELQIPSLFYRPRKIPKKKIAAVILIPGGPGGQVSRGFVNIGQMFVQHGFALLIPNVRGSTGFGEEFYKMNVFDLGGGDAQDIIYGKKFLETLDFIDQERICVYGGSYGGYMTYLLVTKYAEANWKAAVAQVGITHWKTMYDKSTQGYKQWIESFLGEYSKNEKLWEDRSPLNYVDNIKAPILMLQGLNDPRCPVEESRQFRDRLLALGKKEGVNFEYYELEQGHTMMESKQQITILKKTIDFFKRKT